MATGRLVLFLALCLSHATHGRPTFRQGTVYINGSKATFRPGVLDRSGGAAYGYYNASILTTGWGVLEVKVGGQAGLTKGDRAFAAGYLEGVLTAADVNTNANNTRSFWTKDMGNASMERTMAWLHRQDAWARAYAKTNSDQALGRVTGYLLSQFDGMLAGVQDTLGSNRFSKDDLLILVNNGDLIDLSNIQAKGGPDLDKMSPTDLRHYIYLRGMCSALVKLTAGLENLFMSHVTWFSYSLTMRVYKHYDLDLGDSGMVAPKLSFSSYAGYLSSLDDFYLLGSGLVVMETSNEIFNKSLYSAVTPASLVSWQRVRAANHMARNGREWAEVVAQHNSGTYNNQYMVIDLSRVHLKERIDDGALTIVEQIPGLVEYSDQTAVLRTGYWPSYNVPFHERIYNLSGYPDFVRRHGVDFSYQMAPRAKLFRRDANSVASMADMMRLMRSNDYKHDPYSEGDPIEAICARGDLIAGKPRAMGCYDGKVADLAMAQRLQSMAISGPTTAQGKLPPFSWLTPPFNTMPHDGLPPTYNFNWTAMRPLL